MSILKRKQILLKILGDYLSIKIYHPHKIPLRDATAQAKKKPSNCALYPFRFLIDSLYN